MAVATVYVINLLYEQKRLAVTSGFEHCLVSKLAVVSDQDIVISETDVSNAISVLSSLLKGSTSETLLVRLRATLLKSIWALLCFLDQTKRLHN